MNETLISAGTSKQNAAKIAVNAWFSQKSRLIFDFQTAVWDAYARGDTGLFLPSPSTHPRQL
jgi:hypothetical protein